MDWGTFLGGLGLGTILAKILDVTILQRMIEARETRAWFRDRRLEAYSEVASELISLGLHRNTLGNPYAAFPLLSKVSLLTDNDDLVKRIDQFIANLDSLHQSMQKSGATAQSTAASQYNKLYQEARDIITDLRESLIREARRPKSAA